LATLSKINSYWKFLKPKWRFEAKIIIAPCIGTGRNLLKYWAADVTFSNSSQDHNGFEILQKLNENCDGLLSISDDWSHEYLIDFCLADIFACTQYFDLVHRHANSRKLHRSGNTLASRRPAQDPNEWRDPPGLISVESHSKIVISLDVGHMICLSLNSFQVLSLIAQVILSREGHIRLSAIALFEVYIGKWKSKCGDIVNKWIVWIERMELSNVRNFLAKNRRKIHIIFLIRNISVGLHKMRH
jgi:hypothetical protein